MRDVAIPVNAAIQVDRRTCGGRSRLRAIEEQSDLAKEP
jgi:hypothetical protein